MYAHGEQEPPCLDMITRWNLILVMHQQAIKLRDTWSCTTSDKNITHELIDHILILEYWNHIYSMEQWLLVSYSQYEIGLC